MKQDDYNYWNTPEGFWTLLKTNFELFEKCKYFMLDNFVQKNGIKIREERIASSYDGYLIHCFALMMASVENNNLYRLKKHSIEFYFKNSFVRNRKNFFDYFRDSSIDKKIENIFLDDANDQDEKELQQIRVNLVELTLNTLRNNPHFKECPKFLTNRFVEGNKIIDIFRKRIFDFSEKTLDRYEKKCKPEFRLVYNRLKEKYG